jgi:uncharacterized protein with HEPN domain
VSREHRERLHDVLEAVGAIRGHAASLKLAPAEIVRDAILYRLVVIGEAVKAIPEPMRAERPDVNWRGIAGLRDLLTHEYFRIDAERIDELLGKQLDALEQAVGELLADQPERS